jgi:DNA-binding MarR family transcriptional regulator
MTDAERATDALQRLFPAIYLRLHTRRDKQGHRPPDQSLAVLQHLALSGPLTVGEAARHFGRAQSAVSELVDRLESDGLVARLRDTRDKRRVLVWLTDAGQALLAKERQVLSPELAGAAVARMKPAARRALVAGMEALVAAADEMINKRRSP